MRQLFSNEVLLDSNREVQAFGGLMVTLNLTKVNVCDLLLSQPMLEPLIGKKTPTTFAPQYDQASLTQQVGGRLLGSLLLTDHLVPQEFPLLQVIDHKDIFTTQVRRLHELVSGTITSNS